MGKILSKERVIEYSIEFKIKVVELTNQLDVETAKIAEILNLHPAMIYRWRQEYREGKFTPQPTRRISMTKDSPKPLPSKKNVDELQKLKKENLLLKKENDFLKKWRGYLKDQKQKGSDS